MTLEIKTIKGEIEVLTGLHIGGNKDTLEIGGMDNPVIKDPVTNYPYIPGSSLKGKLRSLLEWYLGIPAKKLAEIKNQKKKLLEKGKEKEAKKLKEEIGPCSCGTCIVCRLFGSTSDNAKHPTSLIVRDCFFTEQTLNKITEESLQYIEEKAENSINRITGRASNPRHTERVVPGVRFSFELNFKVFDEKDEEEFKNAISTALALLEKDYLGGNGSRGYGRIKFHNLTIDGDVFTIKIHEDLQ